MKLTIEIVMDGAAFEYEFAEVSTILTKQVLPKIDLNNANHIKLCDSNGNTVGFAEVTT